MECGYTSRKIEPSFQVVCEKNLGYIEAVRAIFDISQIILNSILKLLFEIHDTVQSDS